MNNVRALLIVDDEPNILRALKRLLRRDGYDITTAVGAVEGLQCLEEREYGVIISDQRMPDMNGTEFFSEVKKTNPHTMRIILSGYTDLKSITESINQGSIYKFYTKPWDDEQLRHNIQEAFEIYELQQNNQQLTSELQIANSQLQKTIETEKRYASINLSLLKVSQEILQLIPMAVMAVDVNGMLVCVNQAAIKLFEKQNLAVGQYTADVLPASILKTIALTTKREVKELIDINESRYMLSVIPLSGEMTTGAIILTFDNCTKE
jgi:response regulator RpfG family c-di-GMP phosphodiesterase